MHRPPSPNRNCQQLTATMADSEEQVVGNSLIIADPRWEAPRGFCRAAGGEGLLIADPRDTLPRGFCRAFTEAGTDPRAGGDLATTWAEAADDPPKIAGDRWASEGAREAKEQRKAEQGRAVPLSRAMWPAPFPGGVGHVQRNPLWHGPSPSKQDAFGWGGSFSRHSRGLGRDGSATPGRRERHGDSSHYGSAFPSPQSPIPPSLIRTGGWPRSPFQSITTAPHRPTIGLHEGQDYRKIFAGNFRYPGYQLQRLSDHFQQYHTWRHRAKICSSKFEGGIRLP